MKEGISGKVAGFFMESKLTILLMIGLMIIGVYSSTLIPREEEPQIDVPMADIMVGYPGASPLELEKRVVQPLEKAISNIPGVEHIHSISMNGQAMLVVQFYVGEDIERSYVNLYNELEKYLPNLPMGAMKPMVKTRSIDDVPMLGLTLWSETYDDYQIRSIAEELSSEIKKVDDVAQVNIIGGRNRELRVELDPDLMAGMGVDALKIMQMIKANHAAAQSGAIVHSDQEFLINTNGFFRSKEELERLVVGVSSNAPVYLGQVAHIVDGPENPASYVSLGYGDYNPKSAEYGSEYQAVTIAVGKVSGADAMSIAAKVIEKVEGLERTLIPDDVKVEITRNYGETASHKVGELLLHLGVAIVAVTVLVMLAMGWRGGLVVFLSVPLTFALTLFSYYMLGYTLNRITLFALVFVVGIVVDDSIIIAENMHRHFKARKLPFKEAAIFAINEVGNPTILATFTVIAAILPMAFVSGMMGPYMSPMPIGASIAMLLSLFVALTVTPYLGYHFLNEKEKSESEPDHKPNFIYKMYNRIERPLLDNGRKRWFVLGMTGVLLLGSVAMFFNQSVAVKMLPFDNKNEFQVVIDMPEGTTLERTAVVAREIAQYVAQFPEVENYQTYVGTSAPITFNGLVRHYDQRAGSNMADIQVNLSSKEDRKLQSHDIAKKMRAGIQEIGEQYGANVKLVEVPPGPPVLSTLVAEVYGPEYDQQIEVARQVKEILENSDDVVDVDWMVEADQTEYVLKVDHERAMLNGVAGSQLVGNLTQILREMPISFLYDETSYDDVDVVMALKNEQKASLDQLKSMKIISQDGRAVPVGDLITVEERPAPKTIYRKDQKRVVYVLADMAGDLESPVYTILGIDEKLAEIELPDCYELCELYTAQPNSEEDFTIKWDGEWQITLEVFADLGAAFLVVIIIIYMLIVGWFKNFKTPMIMMIAIPLSLVGIVLGHWAFGAYFTATSFIGMIALAGVMVRNSVLLIDFIEIRLKEGASVKEAIIDAGAVRTTPILLTTGAVVIGASIILFDPIFQGLAISLVAGAIVSTILTLLVVPLIYFMAMSDEEIQKLKSEQDEK